MPVVMSFGIVLNPKWTWATMNVLDNRVKGDTLNEALNY